MTTGKEAVVVHFGNIIPVIVGLNLPYCIKSSLYVLSGILVTLGLAKWELGMFAALP
jgi:hypothetical protein